MRRTNLPSDDQIKRLLSKVSTVCVFGSTNKVNKKFPLGNRNTLSLLANQNKEKYEPAESEHIRNSTKEMEVIKIYGFYSERSLEPTDPILRKKYLHGLILATKYGPYRYCFGGCEPMADIAFIEAISQQFSCDIYYIKFNSTLSQFVDEINTVVLGSNGQYIIISPWENRFGMIYYWNGKLADIHKNYPEKFLLDRATIVFSIKNNSNEKQYVREILEQENYNYWLDDSKRKFHFNNVKEDFLKCVGPVRFFKDHTINFADFTRIGATSKAAHEFYIKSCSELNSNDEVQQILKLPV